MALSKINSNSIADGAIVVTDIADGSVTSAKLEANIAITGNLTVDTSTLVVDASNNRVGVATATPTVALDVTGVIKGSSDAVINGLTVGKGGGSVGTNTAVGYNSIAASATGDTNTGLGYRALQSVTSGSSNTGLGAYNSGAITTGNYNAVLGYGALNNTTTGSYNTRSEEHTSELQSH